MRLHNELEQGSPEWLALRAGKITASRAKDARDVLKSGKPTAKQTAYAAQVAVERIAGYPIERNFETWQMREGTALEPACRAAYEAETGNVVQEVGAIESDDGLFLYSPDGLVGDDGLIEIKSLFSAERIVSILADGDITDFVDQCMFGLWLTGRRWIDLCIWCPALASIGLGLRVYHIERDAGAIDALDADMRKFAKTVLDYEQRLKYAATVNLVGAEA